MRCHGGNNRKGVNEMVCEGTRFRQKKSFQGVGTGAMTSGEV